MMVAMMTAADGGDGDGGGEGGVRVDEGTCEGPLVWADGRWSSNSLDRGLATRTNGPSYVSRRCWRADRSPNGGRYM
jgi:hypothetical protein